MLAHVLYHAQQWNPHLAKHLHAFASVRQRHILRRGDNNSTTDTRSLRQAQLYVTGPGRKINDQIIQCRPLGVEQQLIEGTNDHWRAPDHGSFRIDQKTY